MTRTAQDVLKYRLDYTEIRTEKGRQRVLEEAQKALYDMCVAALPEKRGMVLQYNPDDTEQRVVTEYESGHNQAIDQSIEALAKVFNQERTE